MTTNTAALIKQVLAEIQPVRALRHAVVGVAHLASGFSVLFMKKWMQPERVLAVSFFGTGGRAAVPAMTGGTTEPFRLVNLQQFFARMADECARHLVNRFLAGPVGRHVIRRNRQ